MTTDLVRIAEATGFERSKVELIKDTIARNASDDELMLFLHLAQRTGLDPFSKQIYLIKRWNSDARREVMTPQTGIDGLRLIADRTDRYAPGRAPTYTYDENGRLETATAYVKKWVRGEWHEVAAMAHYDEYVQTKKDGGATQMWADKPHIMLAKCAEALALRRAFPADMNGLYTPDEIRDDTPVIIRPPAPAANPITGEVIDAPPPVAARTARGEGGVSVVPARDLSEAQALVAEIRQLGGDPGEITKRKLQAMDDAEFKAYIAGMRESRNALIALQGQPEESMAA